MKHFRKFLIALLIFAMLLAAVVVTVIAADNAEQPAGSMVDARALLDTAVKEKEIANKSVALGVFYKYIVSNPIPPESVGYAEMIAEYEALSLELAKSFLSDADEAGNNVYKRSEALITVWSHLVIAPIANSELDGYAEFVASYSKKAFETAQALFTDFEAGHTPLSAVYTHISSARIIDYYAEGAQTGFKSSDAYKGFIKSYNTAALAVIGAEVDKIAAESVKDAALASSYEAYVAAPPVDDASCYDETGYTAFKESCNALIAKYDAALSETLAAYASAVGTAVDLDAKKAIVDSAVALLKASPVFNANAEAYKTAYAAYNSAMFDVAKLYYNDLQDEKASLDTAISNYVSYLACSPTIIYKKPALPEFSGDIAIATALINAYKAEGADKLESYAALYAYMMASPVDPESGETVTNDEGKPIDRNGVLLPDDATEFYLQGAMVWDEFSRVTEEVYGIISTMISELDANASMEAPAAREGQTAPAVSPFAEDVATIAALAKYLSEVPIDSSLVEQYNGALHAFTSRLWGELEEKYNAYEALEKKLNEYLGGIVIDSNVLPVATSPDESYFTYQANVKALSVYKHRRDAAEKIFAAEEKKYDMVKALIALINAPTLKYEAPEAPDTYVGDIAVVQDLIVEYRSAIEWTEKAEIYSRIFNYLKTTPVNPAVDGYAIFNNAYKVAGEEVYLGFVKYIDEATDNDDKAARIAEMCNYLTLYPISNAAYNAYNIKLLTVHNDALEAAYNSYKTATDALHTLLDKDEVLSAIGGNAVSPDEPENFDSSVILGASAEISGFVGAIDNVELVEAYALATFYNMVYLQDNLTEDYVAMLARATAVKQLNAYVKKYSIASSALGYQMLTNEIATAKSAYDAAVADAKAKLDAAAPLVEDDLNSGYTYRVDFEDASIDRMPLRFVHSDSVTGKNTGTDYRLIDREGGKQALELVYGHVYDQGTSPTDAYIEPNKINSLSGVVMEFDVSAESALTALYFSCTEDGLATGQRVSTNFFAFLNNQIIPYENGAAKTASFDGASVIVPGEWTHVIAIYNPDGPTMSLYIDYEYVGKWDVKNAKDTYVFTALRITCLTMDVSARIDDFDFYQGTSYRNRNRFDDSTSDNDRFKFYVEKMCDTGRSSNDRLHAYEKATALYSSCDSEIVGDYMKMYESLNVETDIKAPAKQANIETLAKHLNELKAYGSVTTTNKNVVVAKIEKIESFIASNSKNIDQNSSVYSETTEYIESLREDISGVEILTNFISAIARFDRATTLASKTKHYNTATTYYDSGEFNLSEKRALFANDPKVLEFEKAINGDIPQSNENYVTIFEYYDTCLEALGTQEMWENSKRIIDCVEFILSIEDYEHTEAVWEANYDYVNKYVSIIREVIRTDNYSKAYPGVDAAIAEYEKVNVYFYAILQAEHIEVLEEKLSKYSTTDSYIEKLGISTFVDNYVAANDIDMTNEVLADLVLTNEVYKKELVIYRDKYASLLEQNTVYFINTVNKMASYVDYKDIKSLYDEAIVYYYEMNVDSEIAKAAIELFESYSDILETQETASAMFLGYAEELKSAKNDNNIYLALVGCSAYVNDITENIEGVSEAYKLYESKLADYNAMVAPRNGEIEQVNDVVSAVRSGSVASAILAVINSIFNR